MKCEIVKSEVRMRKSGNNSKRRVSRVVTGRGRGSRVRRRAIKTELERRKRTDTILTHPQHHKTAHTPRPSFRSHPSKRNMRVITPTERKPGPASPLQHRRRCVSPPSSPSPDSVHPSHGHGERARIDRDALGAVVGLVDAHEPIGHCAQGMRAHRYGGASARPRR